MCVVVSDLCGVTPTRERVHAAVGCAETACVVVSDLWGVCSRQHTQTPHRPQTPHRSGTSPTGRDVFVLKV